MIPLLILAAVLLVPALLALQGLVLMALLHLLAIVIGTWVVALGFWACVVIVLLLNFIGAYFRSTK